MISIFNKGSKKQELINTNGEYALDNICIKAEIYEELNGMYSLDCEFLIDKSLPIELYNLISEDNIIKIKDEKEYEFFRITTINKGTRNISVFARHIYIADTLKLFLEDVRPTDKSGREALEWIFQNTNVENEYTVSSDIETISTANYVRKRVYEALFDSDNSFLTRWGGEIEVNQFNITFNKKRGSYKGFQIRSRKNLTGFNAYTNLDNVATRIYPIGYDGLTIPEKYIDSSNIGAFSMPIPKEAKFDIKVKEKEDDEEGFNTLEEAQEELRKRTLSLFNDDKIDKIQAEYTVNFIQLEQTEEYKEYASLEVADIGDYVDVIEESLGIDIRVRVLARKYDALRKSRIETELSTKDLKPKIVTIESISKVIDNIDETIKDSTETTITDGLKNSEGEKVLWIDENGNLSVKTLRVYGNGNNTVNLEGLGAKAINLKSDDAKSLFINFLRGADTKSRIGVYAQDALSDRSYQIFIEPGSTTSENEPMVILRGANSTSKENEICILETHGDIVAIRNLYIGSNAAGNKINVREEIESLKARINALEGGA